MKHPLSLPMSSKGGKRHLEICVQRLGKRTGNFVEMLFCCPVLFIFFSSSCSAGQWLKRSVFTLMNHTYRNILLWAYRCGCHDPGLLSFWLSHLSGKTPTTLWKYYMFSYEEHFIGHVQIFPLQQPRNNYKQHLCRAHMMSHCYLRGSWMRLKQLPVHGKEMVTKWEKAKFGCAPDSYLCCKCGRKNNGFLKTPHGKSTIVSSNLSCYPMGWCG